MIQLLVKATDGARDVQRELTGLDGQPIPDDATRKALTTTASYLLELLQRLKLSVEGLIRVVEMFESEGYVVAKSDQLRECVVVLVQLIEQDEEFLDSLEWQVLEKELIPNEQLLRIREYLQSTGQASA